ncbi:MAG: C40 family peptidase, partial [Muribaculaceae bacterium]
MGYSRVIKYFTIAFFAIVIFAITTQSAFAEKRNLRSSKSSEIALEMADSVLAYADNFLGTRYSRGSAGPTRFDCSGFTSYVFSQFGYDLNRSSKGQFADGVNIHKESIMPGDLVFFGGSRAASSIGHVGIVVSVNNGGFKFIHASVNGVRISKFPQEKYYANRYIGARRVLPIKTILEEPVFEGIIKKLTSGVSLLKVQPIIIPSWNITKICVTNP